MAFFARVSDPMVGGTYMTFLNTVNHFLNKFDEMISDKYFGHNTIDVKTQIIQDNKLEKFNETISDK